MAKFRLFNTTNPVITNTIALTTVIANLLARQLKFSWLVGSQTMFFSAINIIAPLSGILGGWSAGLLALSMRLLSGIIAGQALLAILLAYLPQVLASWYWLTNSRWLRVGYSLGCMALFSFGTHYLYGPANYAQLYALLWLIPAAIGYWQPTHSWWRALGSTFSAHAAGSLIWLALVPMTVAQWVSAIPLALLERLLFATGLFALYRCSQLTAWSPYLLVKYQQLGIHAHSILSRLALWAPRLSAGKTRE